MSARSAGRIAATDSTTGPLIPQVAPGAVISSGERSGLASMLSSVPTEALTISLAGVACVNLVQSPDTSGEKVAAV